MEQEHDGFMWCSICGVACLGGHLEGRLEGHLEGHSEVGMEQEHDGFHVV